MRQEPVNLASIRTFLQRTAARRAVHPTRGPLVQALQFIMQRAEARGKIDGDIGYITVVNQCAATGLEVDGTELMTRSFTGINKLPSVPPLWLREALRHEIQLDLPRS